MTPEQIAEYKQDLEQGCTFSWRWPSHAEAIKQLIEQAAQLAAAGEQLRGMREALEEAYGGMVYIRAETFLALTPTAAEATAKANAAKAAEYDGIVETHGDPEEEETLTEVVQHLLDDAEEAWGRAGENAEKAAKWDRISRFAPPSLVAQTNYGKGQGNCLTACVSTVTGIPPDSLPEFCSDRDWFPRLARWAEINSYGITYWRHEDMPPVLSINQHLILLLALQGTDELHAVVARSEATAIARDAEKTQYEWKSFIVHDPNEKGTPEIVGVDAYLLLQPLDLRAAKEAARG